MIIIINIIIIMRYEYGKTTRQDKRQRLITGPSDVWLTERTIDWLIDCCIDWLIDGCMDRLANLLANCTLPDCRCRSLIDYRSSHATRNEFWRRIMKCRGSAGWLQLQLKLQVAELGHGVVGWQSRLTFQLAQKQLKCHSERRPQGAAKATPATRANNNWKPLTAHPWFTFRQSGGDAQCCRLS